MNFSQLYLTVSKCSVGESEADWLQRSRDPESGPWVESLKESAHAASKLVGIMARGVQFLRRENRLDENQFTTQTMRMTAFATGSISVLREFSIQEVFLCGLRFFGFFKGSLHALGRDADWIDLGRLFLEAVEETQELHQTLEVRLLIKSFRCLGSNGLTTANDIALLFSMLGDIVRPAGTPRRLDEELTFVNRTVQSLREHLGLESIHFLGTTYQVFCLLSCKVFFGKT